jgi:uroporphyrinogen decarboxylase
MNILSPADIGEWKLSDYSSLDLVLEALEFRNLKRPPVIPLVGLYSSNLTKYSLNQLLNDATIQYKSQMKALEYFNYDGVLTCMDLTVEAEALGAKVTYQNNAFPFIQEHPIKDPMQIFSLSSPTIEDGRLSVFIETTKLLSEKVRNSHFLSSYVIGPFTLAGHLISVETILELTIEEPETAVNIIKHCTSLIKPYIENLVEAGAHNIVILEPTASTSIISPNFFKRYSFPYLEQLTSFIHSLDW